MRIAFITNTSEPFYRGGYERRVWSFSRALARNGHEVTILTACEREAVIDGVRFVPVVPRLTFFNTRGVRNIHADLRFALGCLGLLVARRRFDVVDINATPFIHVFPTALVCLLRGWPRVLTCHEALLSEIDAYVAERGTRHPLLARLTGGVLRLVVRLAQGLCRNRIAVSQATARSLRAEGFPVRAVVENGIEAPPSPRSSESAKAPGSTETTAEPAPGSCFRLITVSRLAPVKSVDVCLDALAEFAREHPAAEWHYDVVGTGSELERLRQRCTEDETLGSRVTFHGMVDDATRDELLAGADAFLLASPREGFNLAALEALAAGCPVVAASRPAPAQPSGVTDYLADGINGLLFDGTARELARCLARLYGEQATDPDKARRAAARATADRYTIDALATRLAAIYAEITEG